VDVLTADRREAEGLEVVAQGGADPLRREVPELRCGQLRTDPGVVGPEALHRLAVARRRPVRDEVDEPVGDAGGDEAEEAPGEAEGEDGDPLAQPGHDAVAVAPDEDPASRTCRRTTRIRCTTVMRLATARRARTTLRTTSGSPMPTKPVVTSVATRRSARSAIPTSACIPRPSARARAYETRLPRTRQASASHAMTRSSPPWKNQIARPAKIAASPIRSRVESRKAPQLLERSCMRAMTPSTVSEKTKAVMTRTPTSSSPRGKKTRAPRHTPS